MLFTTTQSEPTSDPGQELRADQSYARPRQRQGAPTRFVAAPDELLAAAAVLRTQATTGHPHAILDCVAMLANVGSKSVGQITVGAAPTSDSGSIHIDAATGWMWTDLGRIALNAAASPKAGAEVVPSSWWISKPLPDWLHAGVTRAHTSVETTVTLNQIFPVAPRARSTSLTGPAPGRMRATLPRLQNGMAHLLLAKDIDPLTVALALNHLALIPRARLFYVAVDAHEVANACDTLYQQMNWAPAVTHSTHTAIGSRVVPTDEAIVKAWVTLTQTSESLRPARHCTLDRALAHHNTYARATGWLLTFLVGARESKELGFSAASCRPGATHVAYRDKGTGPFQIDRPVLLCSAAQEQIRLYYAHLRAMVARAKRQGVQTPWLSFADEVMAGKPNRLFFSIEGSRACPLGTADLMRDVPIELGLAPNAGRHYWQTALHAAGVHSNVVDFYARHAARGTESMTSTTLLPLVSAHRVVDAAQTAVLKRLGIRPLAGQGRRSTS